MKMSLRVRLLGTIIGAILLFFIISIVGARITLQHDLNQLGRTEVKNGANAFSGYWASHRDQVRLLITQDAVSDTLRKLMQANNVKGLQDQLSNIARTTGLSFLTIVDSHGKVMARANGPGRGSLSTDKYVGRALTGETVSTATLLSQKELQAEGLAALTGQLSKGLALVAAAPISDSADRTIGAIYGGVLMNHFFEIVDPASQALGGATAILQGSTIIASNIPRKDGTRTLDIMVPAYAKMIGSGAAYTGADREGKRLYLARLEPIKNDQGTVIGARWYGIPMSQITSIINNTTRTLVILGLLAMIIVLALAIPIVQALSNTLGKRSQQVRAAAKELGVAIVGSEVSGDHVSATRATVEKSGALIDDLAKAGDPNGKVAQLKSLNDELHGDVIVIDTLSQEMANRMKQAVDRVHDLNEVALGLNELVTGETE